jgi:beta-glucosidase
MTSTDQSVMQTLNEDELTAKIEQLLNALTEQEKKRLLTGKLLWTSHGVPRLKLRPLSMSDGPHGIAWHSSFKRATRFPAEIAVAACWDRALAAELGVALGKETRAAGKQVLLGPGVNICRTPLNGRTFEYFTEDPWLNRQLAVALIQGVQSQGVASCIKHFAANNQETNRMKVDVQVSERALREIYLPVFEAAVKEAKVQAVMVCYNKVNGDQGCENGFLTNTVLRKEWGFKGLVLSDWFAARNSRDTASCLQGGLDLEMPGLAAKRLRPADLNKALSQGNISMEEIDRSVRNVLRAMVLTGCDQAQLAPSEQIDHKALALRVATQSLVLLKNDPQLLPIDCTQTKTIAVLGQHAQRKFTGILKGGSSGVWPPYEVTALQALQENQQRGYTLVADPATADMAIVFAGLGHKAGQDCEHIDRKTLDLPEEQVALIKATAAANPNTVVVLINGSPLAMDTWLDDVPAVLEAWYGGQEAGNAIARVLLGDANPSGKLPVTFPRNIAQCSAHASEKTYPGDSQVHYEEGIMVGYRHYDNAGLTPLFPFGHGLSYTLFDYDNLQLTCNADTIVVALTVSNSGERDGAEVIQCYVAEKNPRLLRPPKELQAAERVFICSGQTVAVTLQIPVHTLAYFDEADRQWHLDSGSYEVFVGASSRDIRLQDTLTLNTDAIKTDMTNIISGSKN